MTASSSGTRVSWFRRTASSSGRSAAVTFASPTGAAGPDVDGGSGEGEGAGEAATGGAVGVGGEVVVGGADGSGSSEGAGEGSALGDSGGAGGVVHEVIASTASPQPTAATTAPRLMESAPAPEQPEPAYRGRSLPGRAAPRHGGGPHPAQPKAGISPTVVDMSITAKAAPWGSVTAAKRPNGLSIGPKCSFPPCFFVFSTASSQFGTPK